MCKKTKRSSFTSVRDETVRSRISPPLTLCGWAHLQTHRRRWEWLPFAACSVQIDRFVISTISALWHITVKCGVLCDHVAPLRFCNRAIVWKQSLAYFWCNWSWDASRNEKHPPHGTFVHAPLLTLWQQTGAWGVSCLVMRCDSSLKLVIYLGYTRSKCIITASATRKNDGANSDNLWYAWYRFHTVWYKLPLSNRFVQDVRILIL